MRKMKNKWTFIVSRLAMNLALIALSFFATSISVSAESIVKNDKVWTVQFNKVINPISVNDATIYIVDNEGEKIETVDVKMKKMFNDGNDERLMDWYSTVKLTNSQKYQPGTYTIHVTDGVKDLANRSISNPQSLDFTIEEQVEHEPVPEPEVDYKNMTVKELETHYGTHTKIERLQFLPAGEDIIVTNLVEQYKKSMDWMGSEDFPPFEEWLEEEKVELRRDLLSELNTFYPQYELISFDGQAYYNSPILNDEILRPTSIGMEDLHKELPRQPKGKDEFLLDFQLYSKDFAVYLNDQVVMSNLLEKSFVDDSTLYASPKGMFSKVEDIVISENQSSLSYKNNTIEWEVEKPVITVNGEETLISNMVKSVNGVVMIPVKEILSYAGLNYRVNPLTEHVQVANFELETDPRIWDESWVK
ncbi:Ig-like domain-containing protein [Pontibacillus sp. ALD_SL1]|uniref:Ig-like domain-containing protein n=1 Tax=Pontibacillus sp. ALD_SL1 TaxID=2777185 RepID=UPI001A974069|nr:Ig-like domain-containing protein [Pontibacillus sp. ALD_SL1]QSS99768.1 Ig-like domain-containing protein [Pontibacillus sp. ALD_SL1]